MPNLSHISSQCTLFTAPSLQTQKSLSHYINFRAITVSVDYPSHSDWLSLRCKPWHTGAAWGRTFCFIDVSCIEKWMYFTGRTPSIDVSVIYFHLCQFFLIIQKMNEFTTILFTEKIILAKSFSDFFTMYFVHC